MDVDDVLDLERAVLDLTTQRDALRAEVARLRAEVAAVRKLHQRCDDDPAGPPYCAECTSEYENWPCKTIRTMDAAAVDGEA